MIDIYSINLNGSHKIIILFLLSEADIKSQLMYHIMYYYYLEYYKIFRCLSHFLLMYRVTETIINLLQNEIILLLLKSVSRWATVKITCCYLFY